MTIKITETQKKGRKPVWRVSIHLHTPTGSLRKEFSRPRSQSRRAVNQWAKRKHAELIRAQAEKEEVKDDDTITPITFAAYAAHFLETYAHRKGLKQSSRAAYEASLRVRLVPILGDKLVDDITDHDLDAVRDLRLAAGTRNRLLAQASTILNQAFRERRRRSRFSATRVKSDAREPDFWSVMDFDRLLVAAPSPEHRLILMLGGFAGLRLGEIAGLRHQDVKLGQGARGVIHVRQSVWAGEVSTPKGRRSRTVPLHTRLRAELELWCASRQQEGLLLPQPNGQPLTQSMIAHRVRACEGAMRGVSSKKVKGGTHKLRHTFCSHLALAGVSPVQIQRLAGHANLSDTMRYMHLAPSDLDDAMERFSESGSAPGADLGPKECELKKEK